ncbi:MAG: asparagine synthase (glutamine-hydrolyzing) [Planctomycetota bacterium]
MCGFVVVLERDPERPVDPALLARAGTALAHRGPDDAVAWRDGPVGVAFRRLAIQDTSEGGRQPMHRGPLTLAMNGELYGFRAEREALLAAGVALAGRSDTEVLLAWIERHGLDGALARARGMFAFALWDRARRRLSLARDRLGQKPLYLWRGPERVIAASELKALCADPGLERRLDPDALRAYLAFGTVPEPLAALAGVEKLPPGALLELGARGEVLREAAYWDPAPLLARPDPELPALRPDRAAAALRARLRAAVRSHLVADVPVGAYLSSGLDSAGISALAAEELRAAGAPPLRTFSVRFGGHALDESAAAAATAAALGTAHTTIDVTPDLVADFARIAWHLDEPFGQASASASYYLARAARQHVTVALSGDGADELFGGYPWRHGLLAPNVLVSRLPAGLRRALAGVAPPGFGRDLGGPGGAGGRTPLARALTWLGALRREDGEIYACAQRMFSLAEAGALLGPELWPGSGSAGRGTERLERAFAAPSRGDGVARALYADLRTTLCHEMLAKVDRTSMACGLEVRVPYLALPVVEAALSLSPWLKVGPRTGKRVLRAALAPLLPAEVLARKKQGFTVPVDAWFRGELAEWAGEQLRRLGQRGLLRPGAPEAVLARHRREPAARGAQVYALVALEAFCQVFLDRPDPTVPP